MSQLNVSTSPQDAVHAAHMQHINRQDLLHVFLMKLPLSGPSLGYAPEKDWSNCTVLSPSSSTEFSLTTLNPTRSSSVGVNTK